jgi:26S proteasome regulatory subunit N6
MSTNPLNTSFSTHFTNPSNASIEQQEHPLYDDAISEMSIHPQQAIAKFQQILMESDEKHHYIKSKEDTILHLGTLYIQLGQWQEFKKLFIDIRPFFKQLPKSRTAKLVRTLIDLVVDPSVATVDTQTTHENDTSNSMVTKPGPNLEMATNICLEAIEWCKQEKRTFLKQRIQTKLAFLYISSKQYHEALQLLNRLTREVKKFDDKLLLVEIFLFESRAHFALQHLPKAKGALTAARTSANAIYCPPHLQAEIDLMAGIIGSAEKDYKTSFSYFFEAFENYQTAKNTTLAIRSLKYMLLTKIILQQYDDVLGIITGKSGIKFSGKHIEAMRAITDAYKNRDIHQLEEIFKLYPHELVEDEIISYHLKELKEQLLESNLLRILEPFSRVQIAHVAHLIKLDQQYIESKLSEMILDKKLNGILDQGTGDLILFEKQHEDITYKAALETISNMNTVVDELFEKTKLITAN